MYILFIFFIFIIFFILKVKKYEHFSNHLQLKIEKGEKLQSFFLKKALNEISSKSNIKKIKIKCYHYQGINYVNNIKIAPPIISIYTLNHTILNDI